MKQKLWYLATALIMTGIFSFTAYTGNTSKQDVDFATGSVKTGETKYLYNNNGSIKQIIFRKNASAVMIKHFNYDKNKVTIKEMMNSKLIKTETADLANGIITHLQVNILNDSGKVSNAYDINYQYNASWQIARIIYGNKGYHQYEYDERNNLLRTKWHNEKGEVTASCERQYFPALPDDYVSYNSAPKNNYGCFFPPFKNSLQLNPAMDTAVKKEISFDGKYGYSAELDGYILKGKYSKKPGSI